MRFFKLAAVLSILLSACAQERTAERRLILLTIQPFEFNNQAVLQELQISLTKDLGLEQEVILLESKALPKNAFVNIKSPRFRADSLIRYLKRAKPDSVDYILGLTSRDISTTKLVNGKVKEPKSRYQDWGIFGLGFRPGPSCMVSTYRLKSKSRIKTLERYKKVCLHEIGHNLGLKHCPDKNCVMTDACESIRTVDKATRAFCTKCKSKIN